LKSFEAFRQEQEKQEERASELEHECVTATLDLYKYADAHTKEITVRNGEGRIATDGVPMAFCRKLETSKSLSPG
jgi:hypothetical protein